MLGIEDPEERRIAGENFEKEYEAKFSNPYEAASHGFIDDIIIPRTTRFRVIKAFQSLATKKENVIAKKHGNIPL